MGYRAVRRSSSTARTVCTARSKADTASLARGSSSRPASVSSTARVVRWNSGTDESCMAAVHDEIGRAVGLPSVLGGIPLDDLGATGYGLACCADALAADKLVDLDGARVVVQGFGAVGAAAASALAERGARIIAVSDIQGATYREDGLDVAGLLAAKKAGKPVADFAGGSPRRRDETLWLECELLVPAAGPDQGPSSWRRNHRLI